MSSIFASSKGSKASKRVRSKSVGPTPSAASYHRRPAVVMNSDEDVPMRVCVELASATMRNPSMHTGVFFRTATESARDIHQSDAVIITTAAILEHIGNSRMAEEMLSKSGTCSDHFASLGLKNKTTRSVFVTLIFALNQNFVTMIKSSLEIALRRASELKSTEYSYNQLANVIATLSREGIIRGDEIEGIMDDSGINESRSRYLTRAGTAASAGPRLLLPSDSVSNVGSATRPRRKIAEEDLRAFIKRRRSSSEPEFDFVFPSADKPVSAVVNNKRDKFGIGYISQKQSGREIEMEVMDILGRHSVPSVNIASGDIRRRQPRVEDYLESEELSNDAIEPVPLSRNITWSEVTPAQVKQPLPTETFLPDSVIESNPVVSPVLRPKESWELLLESLSVNK
jgi:hypothetical protein